MARRNNVRTVMLPDEVFNGLKTAAAVQNTSISKIIETLARQYLAMHSEEIQQTLQRQMSLFDFDTPADSATQK